MPATLCSHCGRIFERAVLRCGQCRAGDLGALEVVRAAVLFKPPLRDAIHVFKYESQPALAPLLARYLVAVFAQPPWADLRPAIDGVIPVPLHEERTRERGYNQSSLLAQAFAQAMGLACVPEWIDRVRATRPQVGLSRVERRANVEGAFVASPAVAGKRLLLIDDVFTTGATLQACAQAARAGGARAIYGLTLAGAAGLQDR